MTTFSDISLITLTTVNTEKTAGVLTPAAYLQSGITTLPGGHDFNIVLQQSLSKGPNDDYPTGFSVLALAGHFVKGKPESTIDPTTGLTSQTLSHHINILTPGCEGITVDNVYTKFGEFQTKLAELTGLVELNAWINYYIAENFNTTHTAVVDSSDFSIEWWMDHQINWPRVDNAV